VSARRWIALWAGFLAVLAVLALIFKPGILPPLLLGGAALWTFTLALLGDRLPLRRPEPGSPLPAVTAAFGITLVVAGAEFGIWMLAIGAGLLAASLGALAAERVAR
jgi:hypothetical protein